MYSEILSQIQTTDDLETLKSEIDLLKNSNFDEKASFSDVLSNKIRKRIADLIGQEIQSSKNDTKSYLDGLEKKLGQLKTVRLVLSYEPDSESMNSIYHWFSENLGNEFVMDIYVNPNIVGGAQVSFNGKYYDGSITSKIDKIYQEISKSNTKTS